MSLVVAMPLCVTRAKYSDTVTTNVYKAMTWYHNCVLSCHFKYTPHSSPCCDSHPADNFITNVADTLCEGHTDWIGATIPVGLWTIFCVIKYFPTTSAIDRGRGPDTAQRKVDKEGERTLFFFSHHEGTVFVIISHILNVWLENFSNSFWNWT